MNNLLLHECTKDNENWWNEGEMYPALVVTGGFVLIDDDLPSRRKIANEQDVLNDERQ